MVLVQELWQSTELSSQASEWALQIQISGEIAISLFMISSHPPHPWILFRHHKILISHLRPLTDCYILSGDHCEKCSDGWYGNATNATPEDCSPCPCPGGPFAVNQFARTCVLSSDGLPTCVNCSVGHEGRYCERCMDGYFGRPRVSLWTLT